MLRVGAMFVIPADRFDASTLSHVRILLGAIQPPSTMRHMQAGIGVAKNLFVATGKQHCVKGIEIAREVPVQARMP